MKAFVLRYPIWSFLIVNYLISWAFLYPSYQLILEHDTITPLALFGLIGAYGPSIAAIVIQAIISRNDLKALLKKLLKVKATWKLLIFILIVPILLYLISYLISAELFEGYLDINWAQGFSGILFWVLAALPFGPLGEELGWRGFMLPKLLEKYSIFKSTLLVGLAWGVWHLASFSFPGAAIPEFLPVTIWSVGLFCMYTISLSSIYTYVHFKSGGSVFYAILLHAFFNAASNITFDFFGETNNFTLLLSTYGFNIIFAALLGSFLLLRKNLKGS